MLWYIYNYCLMKYSGEDKSLDVDMDMIFCAHLLFLFAGVGKGLS